MYVMKRPAKIYGGDAWTVVEDGFDPKRNRLSESIFAVSNEHMGVRAYLEEGYSGDGLLGSYFNHLYDVLPLGHDQVFKGMVQQGGAMINAVDWLYTRLRLDGEDLDLARVRFHHFRRTLNMRELVYTRELVWRTCSGKELRITFIRFANMDQTKMGCQRIVLEPLNFSGELELTMGLDFDTRYEIASGWTQTKATGSADSGKAENFWREVRKGQTEGVYSILARTRGTGFHLFSSFRLQSDQTLCAQTVTRDKFIGAHCTLALTEGRSSRVDKIVVNTWEKTGDAEAHWERGQAWAHRYAEVTWDAAHRQHAAFMDKAWFLLDVDIDGDDDVLQGLRFSILSSYQTYRGENPHLNPLCKGLTGEVYFGWAFWDTEIYCHRLHLFVNPVAAKNLLLYRYHTLPLALQRARDLGCEGARYPFATVSGYEDSGTWQHVDLEHHVSGAVGYAIWHYDRVRQDKAFLYREGIEMLLQICRFYASAGDFSPVHGDFGLYGVMGPDEFHMMVNHNFYTNYLAKKIFLYTLEVIAEMQSKAPDLYEAVCRKVALREGEPAAWSQMARRMRLTQDPKTRVFEQHAGYFDLPHVEVEQVPVEEIPIYQHWPYIKIFRKNMIKQPDVLNHMFFFSGDFTLEEKKANYEFYEARTIHESSLSPSLHAILALELGKMEEGYRFFTYCARLDLDNYNRNTEQGQHATSAAGVWAGFVCGYGGLRSDGEVLSFSPKIAAHWNAYRFRIQYRDSTLEVGVNRTQASFRVLAGGPVQIRIYGVAHRIGEQETWFPLAPAPVHSST